jgi:putative acetyltransferase
MSFIPSTPLTFRDARPGDEPAVVAVVSSVLAEYGLTTDPDGTDADLRDLQASYARRGGAFRVLVREDGVIVGCGGVFPLTSTEIELRKMYLLPEVRGRGLGLALLTDLVDFARARGFRAVVLETASVLKDARALYEQFGFVETRSDHLASRCDRAFRLEFMKGMKDMKTS